LKLKFSTEQQVARNYKSCGNGTDKDWAKRIKYLNGEKTFGNNVYSS
jgi:hypothetical protein